jgi:hypothetical protein
VTVTEWVTLQLPQLALTSHLVCHGYRMVRKSSVVCNVGSEAWETILIFVTGCVFSDIRSEAEETVDHWVWLWAARPRNGGLISDTHIRYLSPFASRLTLKHNQLLMQLGKMSYIPGSKSAGPWIWSLPFSVKFKKKKRKWVNLYFNCLIRIRVVHWDPGVLISP